MRALCWAWEKISEHARIAYYLIALVPARAAVKAHGRPPKLDESDDRISSKGIGSNIQYDFRWHTHRAGKKICEASKTLLLAFALALNPATEPSSCRLAVL